MGEKQLELRFDPRTIEHLGIKMYSQLPYALAELVANAYDAGAENVKIQLIDNVEEKKIIVEDDGDGMSYDEVADNFLVIGRKRRAEDKKRENSKGRVITGKKGLGKLALFGIGKTIRIETSKKGEQKKTVFTMEWDAILEEESGSYYPKNEQIEKDDSELSGTKITLSELSRKTGFDLEGTAIALSKLFNSFDKDFAVSVSKNGEAPVVLSKEMKYEGMIKQFEWDVQDIVSQLDSSYEFKEQLKGKIISSKTPMKQDLRGITIYVNGRLANTPGFFGAPEAGHTVSYISGWIDADYLDEFDRDLISTDRQSLSWDMPEVEELQKLLIAIVKYLVKDWSAKRKNAKLEANSERAGINTREWFGKVPDKIRPKLEGVIEQISEKPEIDDEDFSRVVKSMYDLIPPYTYYHYRLLNSEIQDASRQNYENKNYYDAFFDAMKRYKNAVKDKSGVKAHEDADIMNQAFGRTGLLETTSKYKMRPNGKQFDIKTLENIEEGQMTLSRGIVQGGRNVIGHEEKEDLRQTGLFSEKDCLDMLSLLSHLYRRLEDSTLRNDNK